MADVLGRATAAVRYFTELVFQYPKVRIAAYAKTVLMSDKKNGKKKFSKGCSRTAAPMV